MKWVKASPGRTPINLSEREVKAAIDECRSFLEAARYLKVSYNTFKKYAKL